MNRNRLILNIIFILSVSLTFYLILSLSIVSLIILIGSISLISIGIHFWGNNYTIFNIYLAIIGIVLSWFFYQDILHLTIFLIGANVCIYYFQLEQLKDRYISINLLNTVCITSIVLISGIEKLRGFNKLVIEDIQVTIPIILLAGIATYFLVNALSTLIKKKQKASYKVIASGLLLMGIYTAFSYYFYKEIGFDNVLIPLISGTIAGYITLLARPKTLLSKIIEIFLLIIMPYQIAGLLGVMFAMLAAFVLSDLTGLVFLNRKPSITTSINKLAPLVFLIGAAEIRENQGLITRFNMVSGYQLGWLIIATIIVEYATEYINKLKSILKKNEIGLSFPLVTVIFTIASIMLIIKIGHDEAMAAILVVSVIYLFIVNLVDPKSYAQKLRFVASLSNTVGALAFLLLTRL